MIDTIKLAIPLDLNQYHHLFNLVLDSDRWQLVKYRLATDEKELIRVRGLAELDQQSFRRDIFWDIPEVFKDGETYFTIELSLPKFWYRHNIWLLYQYWESIGKLQDLLEENLGIELPCWVEWKVLRLDICYAWKCPSQQIAQSLLNSLKKLKFPRKKPHIYEDSIMFSAPTYSLKFYLKYPEFMHHDYKILKKQNIGLENLQKLQKEALGVIRCEATLRRQYLKYKGIDTAGQLMDGYTEYNDDEQLIQNYPNVDSNLRLRQLVAACIVKHHKPECTVSIGDFGVECSDNEFEKHWLGGVFYAPKCNVEINGAMLQFDGGGFVSEFIPDIAEILDKMIGRLIGEWRGIDDIDKVKEKLESKYIQSKSSSLVAFWALVQREGSKEVKKTFGADKYYRYLRDLREAGIGLVEPVRVIDAADRFRRDFKFSIPNEYVVNKSDHKRGSADILDFPSKKQA